MKYAKPGEHHKHLKQFVGTWRQKGYWQITPDATPHEITGECKAELILGGRFVQQKVTGPSMTEEQGPPFEGMGIIGYDNYKQKYTSVWMDSMSTSMFTLEGTCRMDGKVLTLEAEYEDPMTGSKRSSRSIYRFLGPDRYVMEMFETDPDGKEFKSLEITYTRVTPSDG